MLSSNATLSVRTRKLWPLDYLKTTQNILGRVFILKMVIKMR